MNRQNLNEAVRNFALALEPTKLTDARRRDAIWREVETFNQHVVGWTDEMLLDEFPITIRRMLALAEESTPALKTY